MLEVEYIKEKFKIGMHLDMYGPVCFKLCMGIDSTELYVLILVCDLELDSRSWGCKKGKTFCATYLPKLSVDSDEIWRGRNGSVDSVFGSLSCMMQWRGFEPPLSLM